MEGAATQQLVQLLTATSSSQWNWRVKTGNRGTTTLSLQSLWLSPSLSPSCKEWDLSSFTLTSKLPTMHWRPGSQPLRQGSWPFQVWKCQPAATKVSHQLIMLHGTCLFHICSTIDCMFNTCTPSLLFVLSNGYHMYSHYLNPTPILPASETVKRSADINHYPPGYRYPSRDCKCPAGPPGPPGRDGEDG